MGISKAVNKHSKVLFTSPQEACRFSIAQAGKILEQCLTSVSNCLSWTKRLREGCHGQDVVRLAFRLTNEIELMTGRLEKLSELLRPFADPTQSNSESASLLDTLFGDAAHLDKVVAVRHHKALVSDHWLIELKDLIIAGRRSLVTLEALMSVSKPRSTGQVRLKPGSTLRIRNNQPTEIYGAYGSPNQSGLRPSISHSPARPTPAPPGNPFDSSASRKNREVKSGQQTFHSRKNMACPPSGQSPVAQPAPRTLTRYRVFESR